MVNYTKFELLVNTLNGMSLNENEDSTVMFDEYSISLLSNSPPLVELLKWNNSTLGVYLFETKHKKLRKKKSSIAESPIIEEFQENCQKNYKEIHNLSGNPLPCPFEETEDDLTGLIRDIRVKKDITEHNMFSPIPVNEARLLLSSLYEKVKELENNIPIWIISDGSDSDKTILLGCFNDGKSNYRAVGRLFGKIPESKLPTIDYIKSEHVQSMKNMKTQTKVFASYKVSYFYSNMTMNDSEMDCNSRSLKIPYMNVECTWNNVSRILELPSHDAVATLHANIIPGNESSPCFKLYSEHQKLRGFVGSLKSGEVLWTEQDDELSVIERLKSFLEVQKDRSNLKKQYSQNLNVSLDDRFGLEYITKRSNLDFTDKLWQIISCATSYGELKESMKLLFDALGDGEMFPFVFPKNNTKIANFVRQSARGPVQFPKLEGAEPLELLIEIGIEKLKRDYLNFFIASEVTTLDLVMDLLPLSTNPNFETQCNQLSKLLYVIESLTACDIALNLPKHLLVSICRKSLLYFKDTDEIETNYAFDLILPMSLVNELYTRMDLKTWRLHLNSFENRYEVDSIAEFSSFPQYSSPTYIAYDKEEEADSILYYYILLKSVRDENF